MGVSFNEVLDYKWFGSKTTSFPPNFPWFCRVKTSFVPDTDLFL